MQIPNAWFCAVLVLLGCNAGTTDAELDQPLSGTFDWIESVGGIVGYHRTPESEGYTVRLEYQGQRVRAFRAGQLVGTATFTAQEDTRFAGPLPVYIIEYSPALTVFRFSTLDQHTVRLTTGPTTQFDEGCCDRYLHTFSRP